MRNGIKALVAVAMAASMAACDMGGDDVELYDGEEAATPSLETQPANTMDAPVLTAQFEAAEGATEAAAISGTVRILRADGMMSTTTTDQAGEGQGFRVEAEISGLTQGEHAWHIHSAVCGEEAPVAVAITPTSDEEGLGDPLSAGQDGSATGSVTVPADQLTLDQLQSGEYSLHVHTQGGVDHGPTVACANLSGTGTTSM